MWTREYLESLSRKDLQQLAKEHHVRANVKSSFIIDQLLVTIQNDDTVVLPVTVTEDSYSKVVDESTELKTENVDVAEEDMKLSHEINECLVAINGIRLSDPILADQIVKHDVIEVPITEETFQENEIVMQDAVDDTLDSNTSDPSIEEIHVPIVEADSTPLVFETVPSQTQREIVRMEPPRPTMKKDSANKMKTFFRKQKDIRSAGYTKSVEVLPSKNTTLYPKKSQVEYKSAANSKENQGFNIVTQ